MIKLFNAFRKKSLSENRFGKYLLYAIGEIVLVVIGILIALQINTANEKKNLAKKTHTYLNALNTEIETNISSLKYHIEIIHSDIKESAETLTQLNSKNAVHFNDSELESFMETRPVYKSTMIRSTFDDLINSGTLEHLGDLNLKNSIFSIEAQIEFIDEYYTNAKNVWDDYQLPYLQKYGNIMGYWDSINGVKLTKLPFKRTKKAFVYNQDYANILVLRMRMMGNYETTLTDVEKQFITLSNSIKAYLEERK